MNCVDVCIVAVKSATVVLECLQFTWTLTCGMENHSTTGWTRYRLHGQVYRCVLVMIGIDQVYRCMLLWLLLSTCKTSGTRYTVVPYGPREHRRISSPHFLAECHVRQLNQASFVLLCFVLFSFSLLCLVFVVCLFLICLLSRIFKRLPMWMALCSLIVLMCR